MSGNGIFYKMINEKATETYTGPTPTFDNFDETWAPHWFSTAESLYQQFVSEGLMKTAESIRHLIDHDKRTHYKK